MGDYFLVEEKYSEDFLLEFQGSYFHGFWTHLIKN